MAKNTKSGASADDKKKTLKHYVIKGQKKTLTPVRAKKTIAKKYYGKKLASKKKYIVQRKMRKSIQVGKVAIILTGKHMGKRCIITKVLKSGLLAVIGPYEVNGVPLKRVDPRYLIVTSTNVFDFNNLSQIKDKFIQAAERINDEIFIKSIDIKKRQKKLLKNKNESLFMNDVIQQIKEIRDSDPKMKRIKLLQKQLGDLLKPEISKDKMFRSYIKSKFTLRNNMSFHNIKF
ncbi:60S ribosomal protein L6-2, putative [Plasmodium berghei]|uniref:60S ribosomal protein L6, putative n=2 Tax=Plasmodium berghei TaxID=5821 RepID=A0A509AQQ7_PLABA|nr:60S ribosomal protein L6, putative [Plasmodium berghei ANKA]CXJ02075.1 60S ribosomal protein L6-2, putative [Plasmodium berghei]SCL98262.1 60S ribosomal protein L6-2, putative [Plasmodium berghei]SCM16792.1 60S ribosomal protein L6-2, putative [Plasmodium berghei]SCM18590.1 60S ribosomal protein L6-2, putative [Plasmodium berghei]SCN28025.1 60S ribosomal protein L6-2, putative [Plasmodium berghei]|eukprot:XP_034423676.1 60S ribosomal protein L6, putative [Plasmodium berghei ANKA]